MSVNTRDSVVRIYVFCRLGVYYRIITRENSRERVQGKGGVIVRRRLLAVTAFLSCATLLAGFRGPAAHGGHPAEAARQRVSRPAAVPAIQSFAAFHGRTTIVFFVATSCMYCAYEARHDLPGIIKWAGFHGADVVIANGSDTLGLGRPGATPSTGTDGPWTPNRNPQKIANDMAAWAKYYHLSGHVYVNPSLSLFKQYHMGGFPSGMVLDAKGRFVARWEGILPPKGIETVAQLANIVARPAKKQ